MHLIAVAALIAHSHWVSATQAQLGNVVAAPDLVLQTGHADRISSLTFSHDGRTMASVGNVGTILLWDVATGRIVRRIDDRIDAIANLAFSRDDEWLAVGASSRLVGGTDAYRESSLWEVATGRRRVLKDATGALAFTPDGMVVSGSEDRRPKLWNPATGFPVTLKLWNPATGLPVAILGRVDHVPFQLQVSPEGRWMVCDCGSKSIEVRRLGDGAILHSIPSEYSGFSLSPDGKLLARQSARDTVEILNTRDWSPRHRFAGRAASFAFSPDGHWLLTQGGKWVKEVLHYAFHGWDLRSGTGIDDKLIPRLDLEATFAFRNGSEVAIGSSNGQIALWNVDTGALPRTFNRGSVSVRAQAVTSDGRSFAIGRSDGKIVVWSAEAGRPVATHSGNPEGVESLVFGLDDRLLVSSSGGVWSILRPPKPVLIMDARTGQQVGSFPADGISSLAAGSKRSWIAVTHSTAVEVRGLPSGDLVATLGGHSKMAVSSAYSPDGRWLATGGGDGTTMLWDLETRKSVHVLRTAETLVSAVVFNPASTLLASAATDKIVIWDIPSGSRRFTLEGHSAWVSTLAFSPNGRTLASGGYDHTIRIWDAETGKPLRSLPPHSGIIRGLSFLSDRMVLSSSYDGTSQLSDWTTGSLIATLLSFEGSTDWLVVTPEGLFDGTADAMQLVGWREHDTNKILPLDTLYNDFFHPDLLGEIFGGQRPKPRVDIATFLRLPGLRTMYDQGLVHIERRDGAAWLCVSEQGAPTSTAGLDVYLAGVPIELGSAGFLEDRNDPRCRYRKALPDSSGPWELVGSARVTHPATGLGGSSVAVSTAPRTPNSVLHVYTVGIKAYEPTVRYASSVLPELPFAASDADEVENFFVRQEAGGTRGPYAKIRTTRRRNKEATRQAIREDLAALVKAAHEDDVVVIFFAGHGRVPPGQEMFYFLPYLPPQSDPWSAGLEEREVGLNTAMLTEVVREMRARRVLIVIDACQSGGAVESFEKVGEVKATVERRRAAQKALGGGQGQGASGETTGVYVLSAATPLQDAVSSKTLKHGLLTTVFLEALEGRGVRARDGSVWVRDVMEYVKQEVPKRAREHGWTQTALPIQVGVDFPITDPRSKTSREE